MHLIIAETKKEFQDFIHKNKLSIKECIHFKDLRDICGKFFYLNSLSLSYYGSGINSIYII